MGSVLVRLAGPFIVCIPIKRGDLIFVSALGIPFDKAVLSLSPLCVVVTLA